MVSGVITTFRFESAAVVFGLTLPKRATSTVRSGETERVKTRVFLAGWRFVCFIFAETGLVLPGLAEEVLAGALFIIGFARLCLSTDLETFFTVFLTGRVSCVSFFTLRTIFRSELRAGAAFLVIVFVFDVLTVRFSFGAGAMFDTVPDLAVLLETFLTSTVRLIGRVVFTDVFVLLAVFDGAV